MAAFRRVDGGALLFVRRSAVSLFDMGEATSTSWWWLSQLATPLPVHPGRAGAGRASQVKDVKTASRST
jgi:hypothetical protein